MNDCSFINTLEMLLCMFFAAPFEFPRIILELLILSDTTFYHLLGLLAVVAFLRIFVPLHLIMTCELMRRNEIADLAEEEHCTEYDIFIKAYKFYYGSEHPEKIKQDFIIYLKNWPDNYILPFYIRNFLEELKRDNTDTRHNLPDDHLNQAARKLPGSSTL